MIIYKNLTYGLARKISSHALFLAVFTAMSATSWQVIAALPEPSAAEDSAEAAKDSSKNTDKGNTKDGN